MNKHFIICGILSAFSQVAVFVLAITELFTIAWQVWVFLGAYGILLMVSVLLSAPLQKIIQVLDRR